MNWDDLRIATAVYETGSFAAAGTRLRINETTVARRLARLQESLGVTLFDAVDGGRRPTPECEALVALAARMATHADRISRLGEVTAGPVGRRRIATTDSLAAEVLAPHIPRFLGDNPGLSLDLLASTENVNFSRWEADIAVRFARPERGEFIVSKLAELALYLCAPAASGPDAPALVCAYPGELDATPESRHLAGMDLQGQVRCTTKNLVILKKLVRSGRCTAVLPGYMCADLMDDDAFRVSRLPQQRSVWLLVQAHLKNDGATRRVVDWIRDCFRVM